MKTAEKTYIENKKELFAKIENLKGLLALHAEGEEINYGHVGDLTNVDRHLTGVIEFLS